MADVLIGYTYDRRAARYRDTSRGRFVARTRIVNLMESQVNRAENRLANLVQGLYSKEIAPGYAQTLMRDEMRRLVLQNNSLGKGGWDRLTFRDYGRAGNQLRDTYQRMTSLVQGIVDGKVTLPQAMNRIQGYVTEARQQFFKAERDALRESGQRMEARRVLSASEHCPDCITLARMGWRPMEEVPLPGDGSTECGNRDKCYIEYRVVVEQVREERVFA